MSSLVKFNPLSIASCKSYPRTKASMPQPDPLSKASSDSVVVYRIRLYNLVASMIIGLNEPVIMF